jgi:hypothetical protein
MAAEVIVVVIDVVIDVVTTVDVAEWPTGGGADR